MSADEPPFLPVGTEVSAKYRGAFCEAKVKKIVKLVKCKVLLKETNSTLMVTDADINGSLKLGITVEVKHPDSGEIVSAIITKMMDSSTYTVVFDDGDENTLRRTQLCLKGDKHFLQSETLDELPLTHPEHFGTPVMKSSKGLKKRRSGQGAESGSESESSDEEEEDVKRKTYGGILQEMIGQVVCIEVEDRKKTLWVPALVVHPEADRTELKGNEELLVKSFKDSKFYVVSKKDTKEFTREIALKNEDKLLKAAFEKALQYYDSKDLPSSWVKEELLGESEDEPETSEDETNEEKDRFVATLYKFMDDRATPINKSPSISNRDLDLFRLFRVVQNLGGYNKVTNQIKWKTVYTKMNLPPNNSGSIQVKAAYKKYLHAFEDFYRKLGSTMGTISRPSRSRHSSGRSLVPFRERESPRSPRSEKDEKEKPEKGEGKSKSDKVKTSKRDPDEKSVKDESESETDTPRKTRTRATAQDKKEEKKPLTREELIKVTQEDHPRTRKSATKEDPSKNAKEDKVKTTKENKKAKETKDEENDETVPQKRTSARKRSARGEDPSKDDEPPTKKVDKKQLTNSKSKKKKDDEESNGGPPSVHSSDGEDEEEEREEDVRETRESRSNGGGKEYPLGTKLKVKYGKGKHHKIYEAKVVEIDNENNTITYLVHYDGWNKRYDEWIGKERIVSVVEIPLENKKTTAGKKYVTQSSPKTVVKDTKVKKEPKESVKPQPKRGRPAGSMTPPASRSNSETRLSKVKSPSTPTSVTKNQRPTRANSIESRAAVVTPSKTRRTRRGSGFTESSDVQSHVSSDSEADDTDDKGFEEKFASPLKKVDEPKVVPSPKAVTRNDVITETEAPPQKPMRMKTKAEMKERAKILDEIEKEEQIEVEKEPDRSNTPDDPDQIMKDMLAIAQQKEEEALTAEKETKNVIEQVQGKDETETEVMKTKAKKQQAGRGRRRLSDARKEDVIEQVKPEVVEEETQEIKKDEVVSMKDNQTKVKKEKKEIDISKADDTLKKRGKGTGGKGKTEKGQKGKGKVEKMKTEEVEEEKRSDPENDKNEKKKIKKKVKKKKEEAPKESDDDKSDISEKGHDREVPYLLPEVGPARDISVDKKSGLEGKDGNEVKPSGSLGTSAQPSSPPPRLTAILPLANAPDSSPSGDVSSRVSEEKDLKSLPALSAPHSPAKMDLQSSSVSSSMASPPSTLPSSQVPSSSKPVKSPKPATVPSASNQNQSIPPTSQSSTVFENKFNTPPDTPQHSPASEQSNAEESPSRDEPFCTKSEQEANLEVETLMGAAVAPPGGDSPNACDMSTISNGSGGSSGNAPSSEESAEAPSTASSNTTKRKSELEEVIPPPSKKRRQRHKRNKEEKTKPVKNMSDSDEAGGDASGKGSPTKRSNDPSAVNAFKGDIEKLPPNRPSKFNFNLEEGNYLEGEERITFLMEKIGEIRKMYMNLKAEVACIDRRRKRHRRKEREAAQALATQMGMDLTS